VYPEAITVSPFTVTVLAVMARSDRSRIPRDNAVLVKSNLDDTAAVAFDLIGGQSSFSILVDFRLVVTNYTDDLLGESAASGQETHFQFQA
jgi:hypothetical protein